jgi:hypothetical protein
VDGHRLRDPVHHRVHPALDALEVGEQAGVVERQRKAAGERRGEVHVLADVAAFRPGDADRQGAEQPPARDHRDRERGAQPEGGEEGAIYVAVGQHLDVARAHPRQELRHRRDPEGGVAKPERDRRRSRSQCRLDRRPVGAPPHPDCRSVHLAGMDRVDHRQVRRVGDDQLGGALEGVGERERSIGDLADLVQEREPARIGAGALAKPGDQDRQRAADGELAEASPVVELAEVVVPDRAHRPERDGEDGDGDRRRDPVAERDVGGEDRRDRRQSRERPTP